MNTNDTPPVQAKPRISPSTIAVYAEEMDALAKHMRPTRKGPVTMYHYMVAVKNLFAVKGWDFQAFVDQMYSDHCRRTTKSHPEDFVVA